MKLKLATRQSPLALIQTHKVAYQLQQIYPDLAIELVPLSTKGDQILDRSLAEIGGKGLFIKTLEEALLAGKADVAVHSLKDVPPVLDAQFCISTVLERPSSHDVLVSAKGKLDELPLAAVIGTSSVRRKAELLHYRPDLNIVMIRGNVNSRLAKLDAGHLCDALILSEAGLTHLGMTDRITEILSSETFLPSVGQGVIAMEILSARHDLVEMLAPLNDTATFACITAERAMNAHLGANCTSPVGSFAVIKGEFLVLNGAVFSPDGTQKRTTQQQGLLYQALEIGRRAADALLAQGAKALF